MPEPDYLAAFPKPLLEDLVNGRWLPIVGAGMSRNASLPPGETMPLWEGLGHALGEKLPADYAFSGAVDAISAYCHEYSRARLIEEVADLLLVDRARPGAVHEAFCSIPFELVCTTNLDFLLEKQYEALPRYCRPVIDEEQLAVNTRSPGVVLLKLHGDVHHPQRLVLTEEDYDTFLDRYPLLATYLASLLISRTAVLIGYSLDDPDFRQVWQVVGDRLGRTRRTAYALVVDATPAEAARFERRGVKVVNLPGQRQKYGDHLAAAFRQLREYWTAQLIPASEVTEEDPLKELALPANATTRLCFFGVPYALQSFYKERIYPIAEQYGLVPVSAHDIVAPGDSISAKIEALVDRSVAAVVDATSVGTRAELQLVLGRRRGPVLAIVDDAHRHVLPEGVTYLARPAKLGAQADLFLSQVAEWFRVTAAELAPNLAAEPQRLLALGEYKASVISAMSLLESTVRQRIKADQIEWPERHLASIGSMLPVLGKLEVLALDQVPRVKDWIRTRNTAVHENRGVSRRKAEEVVEGVTDLVRRLQER